MTWGVVDLGIFIGLNAACINVITEWLSDFKLGYCAEGWYLNQQFCCWQESVETCEQWHSWSSFTFLNYIFYLLFAVYRMKTEANLDSLCIYLSVFGTWVCPVCSWKWNK